MKRLLLFALSIVVVLIVALIVVFAPQWLLISLSRNSNFPLGTIIIWLGIIAWSTTIYFGIGKFHGHNRSTTVSFYRALLILSIILAGLWGGVGYYFSNNWAFNFSGSIRSFRGSSEASIYYWYYNYFIVLLPLLVLVSFSIHSLIAKILGKQI